MHGTGVADATHWASTLALNSLAYELTF